jgi:hypothetical protein
MVNKNLLCETGEMAEWLSSQSEIPLCGKCSGLEKFFGKCTGYIYLKVLKLTDIILVTQIT